MGPLRILLVEDDADSLVPLARLLAMQGYRVRSAASMAGALEAAAQGPFDVLVSDLVLPDGCGLDLLQHVRELYPVRGIAVTGHATDYREGRSKEAGFDAHLVKPIVLDRLVAAIRAAAAGGADVIGDTRATAPAPLPAAPPSA
jgi:DNA-binding response OmpR family regulator